MSATRHVHDAVERCRPEEATPVTIHADDLETTAPEYLRDLKYDLSNEGYVPARVEATACFAEDCSLATQEEVERLRDVIRAAAFLGVSTLTIAVDEVTDREKVEPALEACAERARREGVTLTVDGPLDVAA